MIPETLWADIKSNLHMDEWGDMTIEEEELKKILEKFFEEDNVY